MTIHPPTAHIMPGHPRYDEFAEIFLDVSPGKNDSIAIPISAPLPEIASAPGSRT